jgi:Tfp pilus assembly protein PilF
VKQQYFSLFLSLFFCLLVAGCATQKKFVSKKSDTKNYTKNYTKSYTIQKNFYPEGMSRAEYYEQMAIAYSADGQNEKAIEHFRLSQLHNSKRIGPYLALSDEYRKINKNHLAQTELTHALNLEPKNSDALKT